MKNYITITALLSLLLLGAGCVNNNFEKIKVNNLLDDYYVDIPTGNSSTCIWRYSQGNHNIPYTDTTYAKTSTEKHTIKIMDVFWDADVHCFDDLGNNYQTKFEYKNTNNVSKTSNLDNKSFDW